jgi:hypothetical protein
MPITAVPAPILSLNILGPYITLRSIRIVALLSSIDKWACVLQKCCPGTLQQELVRVDDIRVMFHQTANDATRHGQYREGVFVFQASVLCSAPVR